MHGCAVWVRWDTLDFTDELRHQCDPGKALGPTKPKLDLPRAPCCHWKSQLVRASGAMQRLPDWAGWKGYIPKLLSACSV